MRLLILTPKPDYPESWDWALDVQAEALGAGGFEIATRPWTDHGDLAEFDAILPLVAWGYHFELPRWHALLDGLERQGLRTVNPVPVLRWNTDKAYLADLSAAGVATVPTLRIASLDERALFDAQERFGGEVVVKPPVSAGAFDTYLCGRQTPFPEGARGREMIAQPFLRQVREEGEYSLLFFAGEFSHALVKHPGDGDYRVQAHLGGGERPCGPPDGGIALGKSALAAAPAACAYARVDLLRDNEGELRIIELELIEPSLWLDLAPGSSAAFASAVRAAIAG